MAKKKDAKKKSAPSKTPDVKAKAKKEPGQKKRVKIERKLAKAEAKIRKLGAKKVSLDGPTPVNTGTGATPMEIGSAVVSAFNRGEGDPVARSYWSDDIESCEGMGVNLSWFGRAAVVSKCDDWESKHKIHGASAEGPFVGSTGFTILFKMDVEEIASGKRTAMHEVGVYTVRNGKIVREEFMYGVG